MPTYITVLLPEPLWTTTKWRGTPETMMRFLRRYEHTYWLTYAKPAPAITVLKIEDIEAAAKEQS